MMPTTEHKSCWAADHRWSDWAPSPMSTPKHPMLARRCPLCGSEQHTATAELKENTP